MRIVITAIDDEYDKPNNELLHTLFFVLLCVLAVTAAQGGSTDTMRAAYNPKLVKIDRDLAMTYRRILSATDDIDNMRGLASERFEKQLLQQLKNLLTFYNALDSLSNCIIVRTSNDERIKFYSWDNLTGGTMHYIKCVAQFANARGIMQVQMLTCKTIEEVNCEFSQIYAVHDIAIYAVFYLTFGWGTYGNGQQFQTIHLFNIEGNRLSECNQCFKDNKNLIIFYQRGEELNLSFGAENKEISYKEFLYIQGAPGDELDFAYYKPSGNVVKWKLRNGNFVKE